MNCSRFKLVATAGVLAAALSGFDTSAQPLLTATSTNASSMTAPVTNTLSLLPNALPPKLPTLGHTTTSLTSSTASGSVTSPYVPGSGYSGSATLPGLNSGKSITNPAAISSALPQTTSVVTSKPLVTNSNVNGYVNSDGNTLSTKSLGTSPNPYSKPAQLAGTVGTVQGNGSPQRVNGILTTVYKTSPDTPAVTTYSPSGNT